MASAPDAMIALPAFAWAWDFGGFVVLYGPLLTAARA